MKPDHHNQQLLVVENLSVSFDGTSILENITLTVNERQIGALVGPDGAGKTTILNAVSGLIRPVAGRISFAGEAINNLSVWEIVQRGVVYVPEGAQVFGQMTVLENLEVGAYLNRRRIMERLDEVFRIFPELKERRTTPAGVLSGGQQRLVTLGRGLMSGARLLLLDDPFLELSPKLVKRFCESFKTLIERGLTLLVATQYAHRILNVAHHAYLVEDGRITLSGSGTEVLRDQHLHQVLFSPKV